MKDNKLLRARLFDIMLCFVSILLLLFSPDHYSYSFCLFIHNLFLLSFVYNIYRNRKEGYLTFNSLFSVSLYLTSFVYPVFIYNTSNRYYGLFGEGFNSNLMSHCTALAFVAYSFLQLGLYNSAGITAKKIQKIEHVNFRSKLDALSFIFLILLVYFIANGGTGYFADQFIYSMTDQDRLMGYVVQFITPIATSMLILAFMLPCKKSFSFVFAISLVYVYIILILSTGSRTIPLSLIIITIFMYNDYVKKVGVINLFALGIFFILVMTLVGGLRGEGELITTEKISHGAAEVIDEREGNYFMFARELMGCNRNLYSLVESVQQYGYTYGLTLSGSILGIVPFMQGVFFDLTGIPLYFQNSSTYNTVITSGIVHTKGLGTHAVADIYICWGVLGVILIFFLYGNIISKLKNNHTNILCTVAYYVILSNAVYGCRATIFNLRAIIWTVIIIYFILRISKNEVKKRPQKI